MQQTSLLLDICDLPSLDSLSSEDGQQLEAIIDLCRTKERPDLAAPYAALLCKHLDLYRESECSLWFDAIAEDDIFLVKALVVAGIDINTSINIHNPGCEWSGTAIHLAIESQSDSCVEFLLHQPSINLNVVGSIYIENEADRQGKYTYITPVLSIYSSIHKHMLDHIYFDPNIRWGRSKEFNPLLKAMENLDVDLISWLLEKHANPNMKLFFNGMWQETPFGWLASWYFNDPDEVTLDLMMTMAHFGASPMVECDDGYSVCFKILESKNKGLISVFGLDDIDDLVDKRAAKACRTKMSKDAFEEISRLKQQLAELHLFDKHAKSNYVSPALCVAGDSECYRSPSLKVSILNEFRIKGEFSPANWITELAIVQQDEEIGIHIEQQESRISAVTIFLPAEISYLSNPFTSSIAMGYHFIQRPLNWWQEVEHYLRRYHLTLVDSDFFEASWDELERGY